jgi:tripartite-type tricarboxylate transporter receptor subunit TctC
MQSTNPPRPRLPRRLRAVGIATALCTVGQAFAQDYPSRALRIVVPFPVGSGTDLLARAIGQRLTEQWGQPVVADNRPGAGGTLSADHVAKAPRDGYTLLMGNLSVLGMAPALYPKLPYDPVHAFEPVSLVSASENVLVVHPSLPVRSVKDVVALAKARPDAILYSSAGTGTTTHLAAELFRLMSGAQIVHVPYKGSPQAVNDLLAGQVHMSFTSLASAVPLIQAGRLRAVATTGLGRNALVPGTPTIAEAGFPGFEVNAWQGIVGPAGLPGPVVAKLNEGIARALAVPEVRDRMAAVGLVVGGSTPAAFGAYLKSEQAKWADVVRRAGIRAD